MNKREDRAAPAPLDQESRVVARDHTALKLWLRLLTCTTLIEGSVSQRLRRRFGSTLPRFDLLAQLDREPTGLRMSELSGRLMVTGGNVTGLADQLEHEGLLVREAVPGDRRAIRLKLTASGKRRFAALAREHESWVVALLSPLTHAEQRGLLQLLGKLKAGLHGDADPAAPSGVQRRAPRPPTAPDPVVSETDMRYSAHVDTFARDNLPPRAQWPEFLDSPDTRYPARMNAAVELLDAMIAGGHGDSIALINDEAACSWRQLAAQVDRIAHALTGPMGLVPGNRVLLRGGNNPMMAACWLATVKAGLIAVATMPLLRAVELIQIAEKARVDAVLCDAKLRAEIDAGARQCEHLRHARFFNDGSSSAPDRLEALFAHRDTPFTPCDTASDDVALIAFTSGTTGQPKGTMHFHRDVIAMCDLFPRHVLKPVAGDVFCGTPPLAFTFGLGGMLCFPMRVGAATLLLEGLTPEKLLAAIERHRATVVFTAPTFYRQMAPLTGRFKLGSLRASVSAGEALPDATRQLWKQASGLEMIDGIGSTEMIHIFISSAGADVKPGAIGKVVPGYEARIVDENMNTLPANTVGRLAVRGPTGCRYLADSRQAQYVRDGWNLPGDTFMVDDEGYFHYQARSDDMIISAGYNIAGPEVEAVLLAHEAVAECGVVGHPDPERGQIVRAYIVARPGMIERHCSEQALARILQDHVKAAIAPYKYPRSIVFRDSLPRTETGKLQRFRLRQEAEGKAPRPD